MITWIQTSFQKHHKLALGTLLGITIVSFVFFGAWSGAGGARPKSSFLGVDTRSQREIEPYRDIAVVLQKDPVECILGKHLADAAQIPTPTDAQAAAFVGDFRFFYGRLLTPRIAAGIPETELPKLNAEQRKNFLDALTARIAASIEGATPPAAKKAAAGRLVAAIKQAWRIEEATKLLAGPEYAPPFEATLQWRVLNTTWTLETATLDAAGFKPEIPTPDDKLRPFFDARAETFRIPPFVEVACAVFPTDKRDRDAASSDAPPERDLRAFILNNKDALALEITGLDTAKLDEQLDASKPDNKRAAILKAWNDSRARDALAGRISEALEKLSLDDPFSEERVAKFTAANGGKLSSVPAFNSNSIPKTAPVPADLLRHALTLTTEQWRSSVYPAKNGQVVVFFLKNTKPSRIPEFAEVREKVAAEYTAAEKARLFAELATTTGAKIREAVKDGKKFTDAAKTLGLKTDAPKPFKPDNVPADLQPLGRQLWREAAIVAVGEITPVLRAGDKAVFVHVVKRDTPAPDANDPTLKYFATNNARRAAEFTLSGRDERPAVAGASPIHWTGFFDEFIGKRKTAEAE
jgi:hypothetical protein